MWIFIGPPEPVESDSTTDESSEAEQDQEQQKNEQQGGGMISLQLRSSLCPLIAQQSMANAKECPDWKVTSDGSEVTYIGKSPFSIAKQRRTFFSDSLTKLLSINCMLHQYA